MSLKTPLPEPHNRTSLEVLNAIEPVIKDQVPQLLKSVEESWQPSELLPDLSRQTWNDEMHAFRKEAQNASEDLLVVMVGNMVTEDALPSYQSWFNSLSVISDKTGTDDNGWAQWIRGWTAEEKRHGDAMSKYLFLSGRVHMPSVERTVQSLIRNGFNPGTDNDPYLGFIYTSFQERATNISHRNVSIQAQRAGENRLSEICGRIAGDEARHERAYKFFMSKIFEQDPSGGMIAFGKMMRTGISMPAKLMDDEKNPGLYSAYSSLAQSIGVYTVLDYAGILEHLISTWNIADLRGLNAEAAQEQEYVCALPPRYRKMAERSQSRTKQASFKFSWIKS